MLNNFKNALFFKKLFIIFHRSKKVIIIKDTSLTKYKIIYIYSEYMLKIKKILHKVKNLLNMN